MKSRTSRAKSATSGSHAPSPCTTRAKRDTCGACAPNSMRGAASASTCVGYRPSACNPITASTSPGALLSGKCRARGPVPDGLEVAATPVPRRRCGPRPHDGASKCIPLRGASCWRSRTARASLPTTPSSPRVTPRNNGSRNAWRATEQLRVHQRPPRRRALGRVADTLMWETARPYLYMRSTEDGRLLVGGEDDRIDRRRDRRVDVKARKLVKVSQRRCRNSRRSCLHSHGAARSPKRRMGYRSSARTRRSARACSSRWRMAATESRTRRWAVRCCARTWSGGRIR